MLSVVVGFVKATECAQNHYLYTTQGTVQYKANLTKLKLPKLSTALAKMASKIQNTYCKYFLALMTRDFITDHGRRKGNRNCDTNDGLQLINGFMEVTYLFSL